MAYNTETIIAEKYETIIRRNIGTSRARDFYDLYMFFNLYRDSINVEVLKLAVSRTARKRESLELLEEWKEICQDMLTDSELTNLWKNYCDNNSYVGNISFEDVMDIVLQISQLIK